MADHRITKGSIAKMVERYRALIAEDPERWKGLRMIVDNYPDDYDPTETPEARKARREAEE